MTTRFGLVLITVFTFSILFITYRVTNEHNSPSPVPASKDSVFFVIELNHTAMNHHPHLHVSSRDKGTSCCGSVKEKHMAPEKGEGYHIFTSSPSNDVDPHLYILSAHFDVRRKVVDILGAALRSQLFRPVCVFVNDDQRETRTIAGSVQSLHLSHNRKYTELAVHCPLTHHQMAPSFLHLPPSTVPARARTIPIQYPATEYHNVTVCYPTGHSGYSKSDEFVQSMTINRILGADKAFWYNHSISASMKPAVDYFVRSGHLELIQARMPEVLRKDIDYFGQIVNMHDCFYRNRYTSKYIVLQDMDEVMLPHRDSNWLTLIERLKRRNSNIGSFVFRNSFFTKSNEHVMSTAEHGYIKLLSVFIHGKIFPYHERSKYIVIPDTIDILEVHRPRHTPGFVHKVLDVSDGMLHHYRFQGGETYSKEDKSIMRFSSELKNQLNKAWQCIGNSE